MQVNKNSISQFLTANNCCFMIPVYQRNYDWSEDNCKQLWNDIWYISQAEDVDKTHFLGTICSKTMNQRETTIIDGQQRITTVTLMMKAMSDYSNNEELRQDIDRTYLRNVGFGVDAAHKIKLHLNRRDDLIYRKLLSNEGFTDANQLSSQEANSSIYKNYLYFYEVLNGFDEKQLTSIIDALRRIIIVDLDVEGENPQEIFESLNSTGLDLTDVDLLRNYLLMSLDYDTQTKFYERYWFKIEENVDPKNMVRFFVDYLIYSKKSDAFMHHGRRAHINENNLYYAFKDYYQSKAGEQERYSATPNVTEKILKDMLDCSIVYRNLVFEDNSDLKAMDNMDRTIYSIVNLNQAIASRPVLMYVMNQYMGNEITEQEANSMFDACLSMVFRAKVTGKTGINGQFAGNMLQKLPEHSTEDIVDRFWIALTAGSGKFAFPSDRLFNDSLVNSQIFKILRSRGTKYLLYTLELNKRSAKGLPAYEDSNTSIEHIMPKTIDSSWEATLGSDADLHEDYLNKLGNLALTSHNSEMSNSSFKDKIDWYSESSFSHTRELAGYESWNVPTINKRSKKLAKECLRIWSLPEKYQTRSSSSDNSQKRPPFRFSMIGLSEGDKVAFIEDPSLVATVVDDKHVSYNGEKYSLTPLAARLFGKGVGSGPGYFTYNGQTLEEIRDEIEAGIF